MPRSSWCVIRQCPNWPGSMSDRVTVVEIKIIVSCLKLGQGLLPRPEELNVLLSLGLMLLVL